MQSATQTLQHPSPGLWLSLRRYASSRRIAVSAASPPRLLSAQWRSFLVLGGLADTRPLRVLEEESTTGLAEFHPFWYVGNTPPAVIPIESLDRQRRSLDNRASNPKPDCP